MANNHIRSKRTELNIGQSELARRVGVSRQQLTRIENGEHRPRVDLALRIAWELETSVDALFDGWERI